MCTSYYFFLPCEGCEKRPPGLLVRITQPTWTIYFYLTNVHIVAIKSNTILEDAEPLTHLYDSKNYEAETVVNVILQVKRWKPTPLPALELRPPQAW